MKVQESGFPFPCNLVSHLADQPYNSTYLLMRLSPGLLTLFAVFGLPLLAASAASREVIFRLLFFWETIGSLARIEEVFSDFILVVSRQRPISTACFSNVCANSSPANPFIFVAKRSIAPSFSNWQRPPSYLLAFVV